MKRRATVRALSWLLPLLLGCNGSGTGGGAGGGGGSAVCDANRCPCTEAGLRAAVEEGGGPFTFDCNGPTTIETEAEIAIEKDVVLDGEALLTVDGGGTHRVFSVPRGVNAELRALRVSGGQDTGPAQLGAALYNEGTLVVIDATVSGSRQSASEGGAIGNTGTLDLSRVTVSGNTCSSSACSIWNEGTISLTNSTVSETSCPGICTSGTVSLEQSTISAPESAAIDLRQGGLLRAWRSVIDGFCSVVFGSGVASLGGNVESPGDTCRFTGDQVEVAAEELRLGALADNGGPTQTHALLAGSIAIDRGGCAEAPTTDQRGVERPLGFSCDSGAFEYEPESNECLRNGWRCRTPEAIEPISETCAIEVPDQPSACEGDEPTDNPAGCVPTADPASYALTHMRVVRSCETGFDLDGCAGMSCINGLSNPDGGAGVDNGLLMFDDICFEAGCTPYDLGSLDQTLHDAICAGNISLELAVAPGPGCALVTIAGDAEASIPVNLTDDGCLSGTLGTIAIGNGDLRSVIDNAVVRMTISPNGFSSGVLGATATADGAEPLLESMIPGVTSIVYQFYDINADLSGDWQSECSALSLTFEIGGIPIALGADR